MCPSAAAKDVFKNVEGSFAAAANTFWEVSTLDKINISFAPSFHLLTGCFRRARSVQPVCKKFIPMRVNWSGVAMTSGSGRLNGAFGGNVVQKNGRVREYVTPTNPNTVAQATKKAQFTSQSQSWTGLTNAQRLTWEAAATSGQWPISDPFTGTSRNPASGFELYMTVNGNLAIVSAGPITSAPAKITTGNTVATTAAAAAGAGTFTFTYTGALIASERHYVRATAPLPAGRMKLRPSLLKQVAVNNTASPATIAAGYVAIFGALAGQAGKKIFLVIEAIDNSTGQRRTVGSLQIIIAA